MENDALRMAVSRGSSAKLGHLRVHADACFRLYHLFKYEIFGLTFKKVQKTREVDLVLPK